MIVGWFSDFTSSVSDFVTAPLGTTSDTIQHVSDVAANNPVATAAAVAAVAYATGGSSLFVDAGAAVAEGASAAGAAISEAASGITLSQIAGSTADIAKIVGGANVIFSNSGSSRPPIPSRAGSNPAGYLYGLPTPSATTKVMDAYKRDGAGNRGVVDVLDSQKNKTLNNSTLALYGLGALVLYEALK